MGKCILIIAAFMAASVLGVSAQELPSYAQPQAVSFDEVIHGRVVGFDGEYGLSVNDERGFIDLVRLHPGTIINPLGLTLQQGMIVYVRGYNAGPYLEAEEIDTPYTFYGGIPYYVGHPWYYYGPSVSLDFYFGHTGWWRHDGDRWEGRDEGRHWGGDREGSEHGWNGHAGAEAYHQRYEQRYGGPGLTSGRSWNAPQQVRGRLWNLPAHGENVGGGGPAYQRHDGQRSSGGGGGVRNAPQGDVRADGNQGGHEQGGSGEVRRGIR